jgi:hypothetical protein
MINNRFNALAHWDNPKADRYAVSWTSSLWKWGSPDRIRLMRCR